jgi:hypothetical protein
MGFFSFLGKVGAGLATGGLAGAAGAAVSGLGGSSVQAASDAAQAQIDAETIKGFQNQVRNAKNLVAVQQVTEASGVVRNATQA